MTDKDKNEMVKTALSGGREDVTLRFMIHGGLDAAALNWMAMMRRQYAEMAREISERLPPSRAASLALTKLEEAAFYTIAAAARSYGEPKGYGDGTTAEDGPPEVFNATGRHHG